MKHLRAWIILEFDDEFGKAGLRRYDRRPGRCPDELSFMDENVMLSQLEELARSLQVEIRYEQIKKESGFSAGGLCLFKGEHLIIINSKITLSEKVDTLAKALGTFDLSQVYLRPGLRDFYGDGAPRRAAGGVKGSRGRVKRKKDFSVTSFLRNSAVRQSIFAFGFGLPV